MPTFRNGTERPIYHNFNGRQYCFEPYKKYGLEFWIPYAQLGLELVDDEFPPVRDDVFVSGEFKFQNGVSRRFNIEPCNAYNLKINVQSGACKIYFGHSTNFVEVRANYEIRKEWSYAPFFKIAAIEDDTVINIEARGEFE